MSQLRHDLAAIEEGLVLLHRAGFQHKAWEKLQQQAGVQLDRSSLAILKIVHLHDAQPCRMQDIAHQLGIEAPSVTRKIQELEQQKLIVRATSETDRRSVQVRITKRGQSRLDKFGQARREQLSRALHDWTADERKQFATLLHRLADQLTAQQS